MSKIKTYINHIEIDSDDYRIKKVIENIRNNIISGSEEDNAIVFSNLINQPNENGYDISGKLCLNYNDSFIGFDKNEIQINPVIYKNKYFVSKTEDLVPSSSKILYKNQEMFLYENNNSTVFKACPLFKNISSLVDSYVFPERSNSSVVYYLNEEFLDKDDLFRGIAYRYSNGDKSIDEFNNENYILTYDGKTYEFFECPSLSEEEIENEETVEKHKEDYPGYLEIINGSYFVSSDYIEKMEEDAKNTKNILSEVIAYIETDNIKGWCVVNLGSTPEEGQFEEIFEYLNATHIEDDGSNGATYTLFNIDKNNPAGIPEGCTFLLRTQIPTKTNIFLEDKKTQLYIDELTETGETIFLEKNKSITKSEMDTFFVYNDIKYIFNGNVLSYYYYLDDIKKLQKEENIFLYNKQQNTYFLNNINLIKENLKNILDEGTNLNIEQNKEKYGNLYSFLLSKENDQIYPNITNGLKKYSKTLKDYMIFPKMIYASKRSIFERNKPGFRNMKEIDDAYLELQDTFNLNKEIYSTGMFQSISNILMKNVPNTFSSDRPVLGNTMWLSLDHTHPTIFKDDRDNLIEMSLNGTFGSLSSIDIDKYLTIFAANVVDFIEEKHKKYKDSVLQEMLKNSEELSDSFKEFTVISFDEIFNNNSIGEELSEIGEIEKRALKEIESQLNSLTLDYENLNPGYCIYDTYKKILENKILVENYSINKLDDIKLLEFFYILTCFFKEDTDIKRYIFPIKHENIGSVRPDILDVRNGENKITVLYNGSKIRYIDNNINVINGDPDKIIIRSILGEDLSENDIDASYLIEPEIIKNGTTIKNILENLYEDCKKFRNQYLLFNNNLNKNDIRFSYPETYFN